MTRRVLLQRLGTGVGLTLLAACTSATQTTSPTAAPAPSQAAAAPGGGAAPGASAVAQAPSPQPAAAAQPRSGGTLHLAQTVEIASGGQAGSSPLSGQNITPAALTATFLGFDSLIAYDANLKPQPMLAESWDVSSDFKQIY